MTAGCRAAATQPQRPTSTTPRPPAHTHQPMEKMDRWAPSSESHACVALTPPPPPSPLAGRTRTQAPAASHWRPAMRRSWRRLSGEAAVAAAVAVFLLPSPASAVTFSLGGPSVYHHNNSIPVFFNKVFSERTHLPFAYDELPFVCSPTELSHKLLTLDEVLRGDRIVESDISVRTLENVGCEMMCSKPVHKLDVLLARQMIRDGYQVEWILDGLPGATTKASIGDTVPQKKYDIGFPLGFYNAREDTIEIYNHVLINIVYQRHSRGILIVGFEIYPRSVNTSAAICPPGVNTGHTEPLYLPDDGHVTIDWTYSVRWQLDSHIQWAHRWDMYLTTSNMDVHWYSIINSVVVLLFLTGLVAVILMRTLCRDIAIYNSETVQMLSGSPRSKNATSAILGSKEETGKCGSSSPVPEAIGWKALHADVFRPAPHNDILVSFLGAGIQCITAAILTAAASLMGILGPDGRGGVLSTGIFLFVLSGAVGGYVSVAIQKAFGGTHWRANALLTALLLPALVFTIIFVLNIFVWSMGSSSAIPIGTFATLVALLVGVSLPMVWIGSYLGSTKRTFEFAVRTNSIPREIPELPWYLHPITLVVFAGAIPFSVIFLELYFILDAVWRAHHVHYIMGFIGIVCVLLTLTVLETTIVAMYFLLSAEDFRWQWRAFAVGGSPAIYVFVYAIMYFSINLNIDHPVASMLYFVYCFIGCLVFWICSGTVGYIGSLIFIRHIYGSIKVD